MAKWLAPWTLVSSGPGLNLGRRHGCLPLLGKTGWLTVLVNGTRRILTENFHGDALVSFPRLFSRKIGSKAIQAKRPGTTKN